GAPAWPGWSAGWALWTDGWTWSARRAARPGSPSSCRCGREAAAVRVVIAEDAALMREGLVGLLTDRGHEVCAAVADAEALLAAVAEHRPDVAVVDIRMPPT